MEKTPIRVRDEGKPTLFDLANIAIPHADLGNQTQDSMLKTTALPAEPTAET